MNRFDAEVRWWEGGYRLDKITGQKLSEASSGAKLTPPLASPRPSSESAKSSSASPRLRRSKRPSRATSKAPDAGRH